jgi:hypothetical protein
MDFTRQASWLEAAARVTFRRRIPPPGQGLVRDPETRIYWHAATGGHFIRQ